MESNLSEKDVKDSLLDAQNLEMIKRVDNLDMEDPTVVKTYVQEMRSQSYKNDMSETDKEMEQE